MADQENTQLTPEILSVLQSLYGQPYTQQEGSAGFFDRAFGRSNAIANALALDKIRRQQRQVFSGAEQPAPAANIPPASPMQTGNVGPGQPRGFRNLNPGNLEYGDFARRYGATGSDGRFAQFPTMEAGQRAQHALLNSYINRGFNTVQSIISRWAPPSEASNRTALPNYINFVSQRLGVSPTERLTAAHIPQLAQAIAHFENGRPMPSASPAVRVAGQPGPSVPLEALGSAVAGTSGAGTQAPGSPGSTPAASQGTGAAPLTTGSVPTASGSAVRPPQELEDIIASYAPAPTNRMQFLQRALANPSGTGFNQQQLADMRKELDTLLDPVTREIPHFGTATYKFDPRTGNYEHEIFQPNPAMRDMQIGGMTIPGLYFYSRRNGWRLATANRGGQGSTASTPRATSEADNESTADITPLAPPRLPDSPTPENMAQYSQQLNQYNTQNTRRIKIQDTAASDYDTAIEHERQIQALAGLETQAFQGGGIVDQYKERLGNIVSGLTAGRITLGAGTSAQEAFRQIQIVLAGQAARLSFGSNTTQSEFSRFLDSATPSLMQTGAGRRLLLDMALQAAERRRAISERAITSNSPEEFLNAQRRYNRDNPVILRFGDMEIDTARATPRELRDFYDYVKEKNKSSGTPPTVGPRRFIPNLLGPSSPAPSTEAPTQRRRMRFNPDTGKVE